MQGISVAKFGGPEVLKLCKDLVLPKPGIKEVFSRPTLFFYKELYVVYLGNLVVEGQKK